MLRGARDHSRPRAVIEPASLLALALIALVGVMPIATSRHELTVRHVVCAEHGELTHAKSSGGTADRRSDVSSIEREADDTADGHDHCSSGFLVRGRMHLSVIRTALRYTPPPVVASEAPEPAPRPVRTVILSSAPKTSPPSA